MYLHTYLSTGKSLSTHTCTYGTHMHICMNVCTVDSYLGGYINSTRNRSKETNHDILYRIPPSVFLSRGIWITVRQISPKTSSALCTLPAKTISTRYVLLPHAMHAVSSTLYTYDLYPLRVMMPRGWPWYRVVGNKLLCTPLVYILASSRFLLEAKDNDIVYRR